MSSSAPSLVATEDICGIYSDDGYGEFAIGRSGPDLVISYYNQTFPMKRLTADTFVFVVHAYGTSFPRLGTFVRDAGGVITGFTVMLTRETDASPVLFAKRS